MLLPSVYAINMFLHFQFGQNVVMNAFHSMAQRKGKQKDKETWFAEQFILALISERSGNDQSDKAPSDSDTEDNSSESQHDNSEHAVKASGKYSTLSNDMCLYRS